MRSLFTIRSNARIPGSNPTRPIRVQVAGDSQERGFGLGKALRVVHKVVAAQEASNEYLDTFELV